MRIVMLTVLLASCEAADPVPMPVPVPVPDLDPGTAGDTCVPDGVIWSLRATSAQLRVCLDTDEDELEDTCVTVRRKDRKVLRTEALAAPTTPTAPAIYGLADLDNDGSDDDPTLPLHVCPPTRGCFTFSPAVAGGDVIDDVELRDDGALVAVAISNRDGSIGRAEIWDLRQGRLRSRIPFTGLIPDRTYAFDTFFAGDQVVLVAHDHQTELAGGAVHDLAGKRRRALAGGYQIDDTQLELLDRRTLTFIVSPDPGLPERGDPELVVQDLATGRVIRRFPLADGEEDAYIYPAGARTVALVWENPDGDHVELFDAASGKRTGLDLVTCP